MDIHHGGGKGFRLAVVPAESHEETRFPVIGKQLLEVDPVRSEECV